MPEPIMTSIAAAIGVVTGIISLVGTGYGVYQKIRNGQLKSALESIEADVIPQLQATSLATFEGIEALEQQGVVNAEQMATIKSVLKEFHRANGVHGDVAQLLAALKAAHKQTNVVLPLITDGETKAARIEASRAAVDAVLAQAPLPIAKPTVPPLSKVLPVALCAMLAIGATGCTALQSSVPVEVQTVLPVEYESQDVDSDGDLDTIATVTFGEGFQVLGTAHTDGRDRTVAVKLTE